MPGFLKIAVLFVLLALPGFSQNRYDLLQPVPKFKNNSLEIIAEHEAPRNVSTGLIQKGMFVLQMKRLYLTVKSSMGSSASVNDLKSGDVSDMFKDFNVKNAFSYNIRLKTVVKNTKIFVGMQTGKSISRYYYFGSFLKF